MSRAILKPALFCFLFVVALGAAKGQAVVPEQPIDAYLHLKIVSANKNSLPEVWQNYFILSYHNDEKKRMVGVAFDYEDYSVIHSFVRNNSGAFVYYQPIPNQPAVKYRLIVDGTWQQDPKNPNYMVDDHGVTLSVLRFPDKPHDYMGPQIEKNNRVDFYYNGKEGINVSLTGDFSRWDPFMYPMTEIRKGLYKASITLSRPGPHYYYFIVNGRIMTDPGNFRQAISDAGETVSVLETPPSTPG